MQDSSSTSPPKYQFSQDLQRILKDVIKTGSSSAVKLNERLVLIQRSSLSKHTVDLVIHKKHISQDYKFYPGLTLEGAIELINSMCVVEDMDNL